MKEIFRKLLCLSFILVRSLSLHHSTYSQIIDRTPEQILTKEIKTDFASGIIETASIKAIFTNNGCFSQYNWIRKPSFKFSGISFNDTRYIGDLHLWIGIPEGEWTPIIWDATKLDSVSLGPTVSGTFFNNFFRYWYEKETDWGPLPGSRGKIFSGDLMLSDICAVPANEDLPLLANSFYPLSWPENIYGNRIWRGEWERNFETGYKNPGKFRADQEVHFEFTDIGYASKNYPKNLEIIRFLESGLRGYDIGAKVIGDVLAYNESYAKDCLYVDLKIINASQWNYHDVYLGLYMRPSVYRDDLENWIVLNAYDTINYIIREKNPDTKEVDNYDLSYYHYRTDPLPPQGSFDYVGIKLLQTPFSLDGKQLGLTGWHLIDDYGQGEWVSGSFNLMDHPLKRGEIIQYKLMTGDTSGLHSIEKFNFFYPNAGELNPHFDNLDYLDHIPFDPQTLSSSGPFTWNSGDTVRFAFAVVFGENLEKLKSNCRVAQKIFDNDYLRMSPPQPPTVKAVAGDKKVTLYWDDRAERDVDFLTGYSDFEGYRIYRTSVAPALNQWGKSIHDGQGKLVGFLPLAQFDIVNDIQGLDPQYPHLYLGSNSGLRHSWSDTTVQNGVTYWYAVCAYDRGITADSMQNPDGWPLFRSLENSRGTDTDLYRNLVTVTPSTQPSNYQESGLTLIPLPGTLGNGMIRAIILNPSLVTGHTYTIVFEFPPGQPLTYDVIDEDQGIAILRCASQVDGEEGALFDGIRLSVTRFDQVAFWEQASGWITWESGDRSVCNYRYKVAPLSSTPPAFDYEIRFTSKGDTSALLRKIAPFEIWNLTQNQLIEWEIYQNAATDSTAALKSNWSSGDEITFREWIDDAWRMTWRVWLIRNPQFVYSERDTIIEGYREIVYDTMIVDNAPQVGDAFRLITAKPFHSGDRFCLQTQRVASRLATKDDLSQVKVVPNPYLVSAGWELHGEDHRIAFTHLPAQCEIIIFNVTGEVVAILKHDDLHSGNAFWNLQSHEGMEVASGLYLFVVKTPQGKKKDGKFVVIR